MALARHRGRCGTVWGARFARPSLAELIAIARNALALVGAAASGRALLARWACELELTPNAIASDERWGTSCA